MELLRTPLLPIALLVSLFTAPIFGAVPKKIAEGCQVINATQKKGLPKQSCSIRDAAPKGKAPKGRNDSGAFTVHVRKNLRKTPEGDFLSRFRVGMNYYTAKLKASPARMSACKQMNLTLNYALVAANGVPQKKSAKLVSLNAKPLCSAASIQISMNDSENWKTGFYKVPPTPERAVATRTFTLVRTGQNQKATFVQQDSASSYASSANRAAPAVSIDDTPARTPTRSDSMGMADDEEEEDEDDGVVPSLGANAGQMQAMGAAEGATFPTAGAEANPFPTTPPAVAPTETF